MVGWHHRLNEHGFGPNSLTSPKDATGQVKTDDDIWQDPREDSQYVDVLIVPVGEDNSGILGSYLSASSGSVLGAPLANNQYITDIYGNIHFLLENPEVGEYEVYTRHSTISITLTYPVITHLELLMH